MKSLDSNRIPYIEQASYQGKSGLITTFDFSVPRGKDKSDLLINAINKVDLSFVKNAIFGWQDIKSTRRKSTDFSLVYNDQDNKVSPQNKEALNKYDINLIPFSQMTEIIKA